MITEDSFKLLYYIYKNKGVNSKKLSEISEWEHSYVKELLDFLIDEGEIKEPIKVLSGEKLNIQITSSGIKKIEGVEEKAPEVITQFNINIDSIFKLNIEEITGAKLF